MNESVACMDCGWKGQHNAGPIQGAKCPQCNGGTIVRHQADASVEQLERIGYLCIQGHPHRICSGCTTACCEPVFAYPEVKEDAHGD